MQNNSSFTQTSILILMIIFAINLLILDIKIFSQPAIKISDVATEVTPVVNLSSITSDSANLFCPSSCISLIDKATQSANIGSVPEALETLPQTQPIIEREYYIPLGNGSTDKSSWDNQTATETIVNPGNYGRIKEAYFIASFKNPTQNGIAEAQLYNVTDKHPVWGSHVIMNGPLSQTISSGKIQLDSGNKLYRVQLKSSLNFPISLENAKIRIIAQ